MPEEDTPPVPVPVEGDDNDPLVVYSRALHDYTLRLWAESRRAAEQQRQQYLASYSSPAAPTSQAQQRPRSQSQAKPSSSAADGQGT
jgi:hypothetical protein